jgi:parallel beta-helix repeat protein
MGTFENCRISDGEVGVAIHHGNLTARESSISGLKHGVFTSQSAIGTFQDCAVSNSTDEKLAAVDISDNATLSFQRSKIRGNGVIIGGQGLGTFEDCEIAVNPRFYAIHLAGGRRIPEFLRTRIEGGALAGEGTAARLTDCDITNPGSEGLVAQKGANLTVHNCRVHHSNHGISIWEGGTATITDCRIFENAETGVWLGANTQATIRGSTITGNGDAGIRARNGAGGIVENCDLRGNRRAWDAGWLAGLKRVNNKER